VRQQRRGKEKRERKKGKHEDSQRDLQWGGKIAGINWGKKTSKELGKGGSKRGGLGKETQGRMGGKTLREGKGQAEVLRDLMWEEGEKEVNHCPPKNSGGDFRGGGRKTDTTHEEHASF